jgi:probable phosphoglycerate mutase
MSRVTAGTIVLLRHGRTAWNTQGRFQGHTDVPLDDIGHRQAQRVAPVLARLYTFASIVSSDLVRAADTARACADVLGLAVRTDERLRERFFGKWEGLTATEISAGWPGEFAAWRRGEDAIGLPLGGESRAETAARLHTAVREHADALAPDETLLVVSHGAAINVAVTVLLGLEPGWHGFTVLGNTHWSVVTRAQEGATPPWRVAVHNAGLPPE